MKILLDTHVFIWWAGEPEKLSPNALEACNDQDNDLILSVVSVWEMQIKMQIGKLKLNRPLRDLIEAQKGANDFQILPVSLDHVFRLENLPMHHRDPFDRLLIAQTMEEGSVLVSKDEIFSDYAVNLLW